MAEKSKKTVLRKIAGGAIIAVFLGFFGIWCLWFFPATLPSEPVSTKVLDRGGETVGEILSSGKTRHRTLEFEEIPPLLTDGIIALEDRGFYSHIGVSPRGVVRSMYHNLLAGKVVEGASTITMGLARSILGINEKRSFSQKTKEAWLALRLERNLSKRQILRQYLSRIRYGRLAIGVGSAAEAYFGRDLAHLTRSELIALLVIAKNATLYDPVKEPENFRARFERVVNVLEDRDIVRSDEKMTILSEKLLFPKPRTELPYIIDGIVSESFWTHALSGETLRTTIDASLTRLVEKRANRILDDLSWRNVSDFSIIVADRETHAIRVAIGGRDYGNAETGQVNSLFAKRQVGSTIKPFTYLLAFEKGVLSPTDTLLDRPISFETESGNPYEPKNYSLSYRGPVSVAEALAGSLNIPAVQVAKKTGASDLLEFLRSLGISSLTENADHYGLALTLGVGEISLYELVRAFGVFSDRGKWCDLVIFPETTPECHAVASPENALEIEKILSNRSYKLAEFPALSALDFSDRFVFVKTGTSRNFRDNWAVGYTDRYLIGVWTGNKNAENMKGVTGASGAGEIFAGAVDLLGAPENNAPKEQKRATEPLRKATITKPLPFTRYIKDAGLPDDTQTVRPTFWSDIDHSEVRWSLDTAILKTPELRIANIAPGRHTLRIDLLKNGQVVGSDSVGFEIDTTEEKRMFGK